MPWSKPTLQELRDRFRQDFLARTSTGDAVLRRSVENVFSYVVPGLSNGLYGYVDWGVRQLIPSEDADFDSILRWANDLLTPPQNVATPSQGVISFTGTPAATLPLATVWTSRDGVSYTTDIQTVVGGGGTGTVNVTAVEAGVLVNAVEGVALFLSAPVAGIDSESAVTSSGLSGGADDETKFGVLGRLRERFQSAPRGGGPGDYVAWAKEIASVDRAFEYGNSPAIGWVTVVVVDDTAGTAPIAGAATVSAAQDNIDAKRPIMMGGASVIAAPADTLNLFWSALVPAPGDDVVAAKAALEANVDAYVLTQAEPGEAINWKSIENAAQAAVTSITLGSPQFNPVPVPDYGLFNTIVHNYY